MGLHRALAPVRGATTAARPPAFVARAVGAVRQPFQRALRHFAARDFLLNQRLDGRQILGIRRGGDGKRLAQTPGAPRASDAVDVILGMRGQVEVEHMADRWHIKPPRRHVRGDQQLQLAVTEIVQRAHPHALIQIAMDGRGIKAMGFQRLGHHIHIHLAIAEDDRIGAGLALGLDQRPQNSALFGKAAVLAAGGELDQLLVDGGRGGGLPRHLDLDRCRQEGVGDPFDLGCHGGRVEESLARKGRQREDALDIGDKAHIQHAVGLIHHHDLHAGQQKLAAFEMVQKATGGGNQNIDAPVDQLVLLAKGDAADEQRLGQLGMLGIDVEVFRHLGRKFPRRRQHKAARHPGAGAALTQKRDHRQRKACRFPGAGLGDTQHILALKGVGNGLGLNGGGGFVSGFGNGLQHARIQRKVREFGHQRPETAGSARKGKKGRIFPGVPASRGHAP